MPNTLAHLGVGGLITRLVIPEADSRWIFAGCVIPDVPWIMQRVVTSSPLDVDVYDLRLYAISQASLAGCLLLAGALALLSAAPGKTFAILALNALVHLLLDACQTKWGNGVHLLAPISWQMWNFGLFWPESIVTYGLSVFGLGYFLWDWRRGGGEAIPLRFAPLRRWLGATLLAAAYVLAPAAMMSGPEKADNHFVKTLRATEMRNGKHTEFDRNSYVCDDEHCALITFAGEPLDVTGVRPEVSSTVSVRAVFTDNTTIQICQLHIHPHGIRDYASAVGLGLVVFIWLKSFRRVPVLNRHKEIYK